MPTPNYTLRPLILTDAEAVADLQNAYAVAHGTTPTATPDQVRAQWTRPDVDFTRDIWLAVTPAGRIVGIGGVNTFEPYTIVRVWAQTHPDCEGLGIEDDLIDQAEARARDFVALAPPDASVRLMQSFDSADDVSAQRAMARGYSLERRVYEMKITLDAPPPSPVWPAGLTVREYTPGVDDRAVHGTLREAFLDHWDGMGVGPFELWLHHVQTDPGYDPRLWTVVCDGDAVAGAVACSAAWRGDPAVGGIRLVGVRRAWRRRGLAEAMLYSTFGLFHQRGYGSAALVVDADSVTGAQRLYQRVGMAVAATMRFYSKPLQRN